MAKTHKTQEMEWTNITSFRHQLFQYLEHLEDKCVAITKNGKPQAVLVAFEEFQRMRDLTERWEDEILKHIAKERLQRYEADEIQAIPYEELFTE